MTVIFICGSKIMELVRRSFLVFQMFVFIIFYGIPFLSLVGGREGTDEGPENRCEIQTENIARYSASTLSGVQTLPYVTFEDGSVYRMEPEEPDFNNEKMNISRRKIGETPLIMEQKREKLRNLLRDHAKYYTPWENDAWLIRFLRARNYDEKAAFKLVKNYYKFRANNKWIYDGLVPSQEKEALMQEIIFPLSGRDQLGRRIIVARANKWKDPKRFPMEKMCRTAVVLMELGCYEPATQISGLQLIIDMKDATLYQLFSIQLMLAWTMGNWVLHSVPMRYEGIHVVNEPVWFLAFYKTLQFFIPKEINEELKVHGTDWDSLHKHIEPAHLPLAYGGYLPNIPSLSSHEWDVLLAFGDREFEKILEYGIREGYKKPSWIERKMLRRGSSSTGRDYSKLE